MARRSHFDDAKMPERDMPDLSVRDLKTEMDDRFRELKTDMDGRFRELKTDMDGRFRDLKLEMDSRFERVDARITEEAATTRRHFDIVAESLKAEIRLRLEGSDTRLDNHERRIQALEKRRR
jgi:hypothetical protein